MLYKNISSSIVIGNHKIQLNNLYECVLFLLSKNILKINRLYPKKGNYGNSGWVYDCFTPQLAFEKITFAYDKIPYTFNSFLQSIFPALMPIIDFYDNCNLLLVNLIYPDKDFSMINSPQLIHYYLYNDEFDDSSETIVSLNFESEIYEQNNIRSDANLNDKFYKSQTISFNGKKYKIKSIEGINITLLLYNDFFFHNLLYDFLEKRIKRYYETYFSTPHNHQY